MGLMDRDYWKERHRGNSNSKVKDAYYNPKEFRKSLKARARFNFKWIYWAVILIGVGATIAMERGITIESLKTKAEVIRAKYDGSIFDAIREIFDAKDIIPGILLVAQTDFKGPMKRVEVEIDLSKALDNFERYGVGQDFYYENKGVNGSIGYRVTSIDKKNGYVNGKVVMLMWGAESPFAASLTHLDNQICSGNIVRGKENKNDKLECGNSYAFSMSTKTRHKIGNNFKIALDFTEKDKLRGYYADDEGNLKELGGFNLYPSMKPKPLLTHNLSFSGVISDCREMKPIEFSIGKINNGNDVGKSFAHQVDKAFECNSRLALRIAGGKITHIVKD
jgi:hypothetical protein